MNDIQKLLNKEITKKKFDRNLILQNVDELNKITPSMKYNSLLRKGIHEGSSELLDFFIENKIINEDNILLVLQSFNDVKNEKFLKLLPLLDFSQNLFYTGYVNNEVPNHLVLTTEMNEETHNTYSVRLEHCYEAIEAENNIRIMRNILLKLLESEHEEAMQILLSKGITFQLLKSYESLQSCKINHIEEFIHNADIHKLNFMFDFGYQPVIQDLCYINGNNSDEDNLNLIQLYKKKKVDMIKPFDIVLETRPDKYKEVLITLPAYLFEEVRQIRTSFLNDLIKESKASFFNEEFSVYHKKSVSLKVDYAKLFKFFNLNIDFVDKIDKKSNIFNHIRTCHNHYLFDNHFWKTMIKKMEDKNFDFEKSTEPTLTDKKLKNNFLSYLFSIYTKENGVAEIMSYLIKKRGVSPDIYTYQSGSNNNYFPVRIQNEAELLFDCFNSGKVNKSEFVFFILKSMEDSNPFAWMAIDPKKFSIEKKLEELRIDKFIEKQDIYEGIVRYLALPSSKEKEPLIEIINKTKMEIENYLLKENSIKLNNHKKINRI